MPSFVRMRMRSASNSVTISKMLKSMGFKYQWNGEG